MNPNLFRIKGIPKHVHSKSTTELLIKFFLKKASIEKEILAWLKTLYLSNQWALEYEMGLCIW